MLGRNGCLVTENRGECGVLRAKLGGSVKERGAVSCVEGYWEVKRTERTLNLARLKVSDALLAVLVNYAG